MEKKITRNQENLIMVLLRRGEYIPRIAAIVGVPIPAVERVLEKSVAKECGW